MVEKPLGLNNKLVKTSAFGDENEVGMNTISKEFLNLTYMSQLYETSKDGKNVSCAKGFKAGEDYFKFESEIRRYTHERAFIAYAKGFGIFQKRLKEKEDNLLGKLDGLKVSEDVQEHKDLLSFKLGYESAKKCRNLVRKDKLMIATAGLLMSAGVVYSLIQMYK